MWKPKRPSTDEWINKTCYIYRMGHYPLKGRNKLLMNAKIWMNPEKIKVSERSQTPKPYIVRFQNRQSDGDGK